MKLYNTLTKKKEEFVPLQEGKVTMYVCGPTVYNFIHIGNARPMIVFDTVRRYMEYKGYEVNFVSNFTDVDDKIIKKSIEEGVSAEEVSERYIKECKKDMADMNVKPATTHPQATQEIDGMIAMIETLMEKGYAYDASSSEADYIVYVIDMKSRAVRVVTSGIAKSDISQSDLQSIIDKTTSTLSDGNYYKACVKYTDITQNLLSTSKTYKLFLYMPIKLGIAAVIAIIVVLVMMFNAKTKMTVDGNTYAKNGVHVYRREDRFINTTVTTRTIETNNSSGGSSGGGGGNSGSAGGHF